MLNTARVLHFKYTLCYVRNDILLCIVNTYQVIDNIVLTQYHVYLKLRLCIWLIMWCLQWRYVSITRSSRRVARACAQLNTLEHRRRDFDGLSPELEVSRWSARLDWYSWRLIKNSRYIKNHIMCNDAILYYVSIHTMQVFKHHYEISSFEITWDRCCYFSITLYVC